MRRSLLAIPLLALAAAACTTSEAEAPSKPNKPPSTTPAKPTVHGWGETATINGVKVTVKQPEYDGRVRDEGPQVGYDVAVENTSELTPTLTAAHFADSKGLPLYGTDVAELGETSVSPGATATVTNLGTVPDGTETFKVTVELTVDSQKQAQQLKQPTKASWEGAIEGTPQATMQEAAVETPEPTTTPADPNHCNDPSWWQSQKQGDPGTYVQACGEWPYWVPSPQAEPARQPPTAGYQCRPGDEEVYDVCAGHKKWVDGQVEYHNCITGGGEWSIKRQECVY